MGDHITDPKGLSMKGLVSALGCLLIGILIGYQWGSRTNALNSSAFTHRESLEKGDPNPPKVFLQNDSHSSPDVRQQPDMKTKDLPSENPQSILSERIDGKLSRWYSYEQGLNEVRTFGEVRSFLNQVEVPNFNSKMGYLKPISEDYLKAIQGAFSGRIHFDDGSPDWEIEWQVDGHIEDHKIVGREQVILSKDGKSFSNTSGTGDIKAFKTLGDQSQSIFLQANDDHFVQLYFSSQMNQFIGNFYKKEDASRFQRVGIVTLTRKH